MKRLFSLTIGLFLFLTLEAQVAWDAENQETRLEKVISVEGVSKDALYDRAKLWMAQTLKSSDNQVMFDDEEKSRIIGTGNHLMPDLALVTHRVLNFKMSIFFKEGRIKVLANNIIFSQRHHSLNGQNHSDSAQSLDQLYKRLAEKGKKRKKYQDQIDEAFEGLLVSLEKSLSNDLPDGGDDW